MDFTQIVNTILSNDIAKGGVFFMAGFILALHREWVVMGAHYRAVVKNNEELKSLLHTAEDSAKETRDALKESSQAVKDLTRKLEAKR